MRSLHFEDLLPLHLSSVNETGLEEFEQYEKAARNEVFQEEMDIDETSRHVLPPGWRTSKNFAANLRACCMCGMLKTEVALLRP